MIKIHNKLWVAINPKRESLAYMTYYEDNKAFESRKHTGLSWARIEEEEAEVFDNSPTSGFIISESVSRWSTDNKLFRVKDPRGFTVEVPTGNISTLLGITTVTKGVVMEDCVWGRDGNNHILLPVNSDVYEKAINDTQKVDDRVSITKLNEGDVVTFNLDGSEYVYLGKYKCKWEIITKESLEKEKREIWEYSTRYKRLDTDEVVDERTFTDNKWRHLFKRVKDNEDYSPEYQLKASGKCFKLDKTMELSEINIKGLSSNYSNELEEYLNDPFLVDYWRPHKYYTNCNVIEVIKKG